ncbi:MAG: penicillin-binding transpeptidase domain-containing protein [Oscillospiraceae bacterium]|nr:penicillin-binding transpeptidase domain-containing protein [Oscillospiraceae bacterium]
MESKSIRNRLICLAAFLLVVLCGYVFVLFNVQIVHGSEYLEQSMRQIVKSTSVEAARGVITDRNGKVMVSNSLTYTLTFDASLLGEDTDENAAILRLINLCQSNGVAYTDNLPLSKTAPFTYTTDMTTDIQLSRFNKYLTNKEWSMDTMTAPELFSAMREAFDIDASYSDADARKIMAVRYELALRKLVSMSSYVMASGIDSSFITLVKDGDYLGADIQTSNTRQYLTNAAAHVLGRVGAIDEDQYAALKDSGYSINATIGRDGVESAFEEYLHGTDGTRIINTNSEGKVTSELYSTEPKPGDTVELTLDLDLQETAESLLAQEIDSLTEKDGISRGGAVAVVDVNTGGVLALASYPTYSLATYSEDYNTLKDDPSSPFLNRATQGLYAPGSTFKPLTAIAALSEGKISRTDRIYDTGCWYYPNASTGDHAYCWYRAGHGYVNVTQAITVSCNYFFAEMGYRLGLDKLNEYAAAFGLGQSTGIEIGDKSGQLAEEEAGQDLAPWAAFGQANYLFTPLQLANYIATLVNGGTHYKCHLLESVKSYDNTQLIKEEPVEVLNTIDIDQADREAVMEGMHNLVKSGSISSAFSSCIVDAGAKTGSVQTNDKVANGTFVCFAPYDDPQIAVAVVIEKAGAGASLASTAVGILNQYFAEDEIGTTIIGENQLIP